MAKGEPRLINGIWFFADGTRMAQVAGGQDPPDGGDDGSSGTDGDDQGDGGQQGDQGDGGAGSGSQDQDDDPQASWPAEARAALKAANSEAARRKRELREVAAEKDRLKAAEDARTGKTKSEVQKLSDEKAEAVKRAESAEAALKAERVRNHVFAEAMAQGFRKPDVAFKLLEVDDLEYDDGEDLPKNAKTLLQDLAKDMPELIAASDGKGGTTVGAPGNGKSSKNLTDADIDSMTQDEINANWEAINATRPAGQKVTQAR